MPPPIISDVRAAFETDIDDATIQALLDAETEEVKSRYGSETSEVDEVFPVGCMLSLSRKAASITSVVEIQGTVETTLNANDYRLRNGGWMLERLSTGANSRYNWLGRVLVTYVVAADARRFRVILDLVKLGLQYEGLKTKRLGDSDFESEQMEYQKEREAILSTLGNSTLAIA